MFYLNLFVFSVKCSAVVVKLAEGILYISGRQPVARELPVARGVIFGKHLKKKLRVKIKKIFNKQ